MTSWSLVIAASQRSGSTLLGRALELTGMAGKPREWFQNSNREERLRAYDLPPHTPRIESLRTIVRNETTENGVFALKIMWDTFAPLLQCLRDSDPGGRETDGGDFERFSSLIPSPRFVFVSRRDKLKQAVSFVKCLQSGVWEYRGENLAINKRFLEFDFIAISEAMAKFRREESAWEGFFTANRIPYFHVVYEDFVADYSGTLERIFDFFALPVPEGFRREAMDLKVMADDLNKAWEKRYLEWSARAGGQATTLPRLKLLSTTMPDRVVTGTRHRVEVKVLNAGRATVSSIGSNDGENGWTLLRARWRNESTGVEQDDCARGYLQDTLAVGGESVLPMVVTAPMEAGKYSLRVVCTHTVCGGKSVEVSETVTQVVRVDWDEGERGALAFFPEATKLIGGWKWIPWLGYFYMRNFPWMCHEKMGWLFFDTNGSHGGEYWFHENTLGWFQTAPGLFPEVLRRQPEERLIYDGPIENVCRFRRADGDGLIDVVPKFR